MRWPNADHWRRSETALRIIAGKSWRRSGEEILGLQRGQLRAHIDRVDITHDELIEIEDKIGADLAAFLSKRDAETAKARDALEEFNFQISDRRSKVRAAEIADYDAYVDWFMAECNRHIMEAA